MTNQEKLQQAFDCLQEAMALHPIGSEEASIRYQRAACLLREVPATFCAKSVTDVLPLGERGCPACEHSKLFCSSCIKKLMEKES